MSLLVLTAAVSVKVDKISPIIANIVWLALLAGIFVLATRIGRRRRRSTEPTDSGSGLPPDTASGPDSQR